MRILLQVILLYLQSLLRPLKPLVLTHSALTAIREVSFGGSSAGHSDPHAGLVWRSACHILLGVAFREVSFAFPKEGKPDTKRHLTESSKRRSFQICAQASFGDLFAGHFRSVCSPRLSTLLLTISDIRAGFSDDSPASPL